MWHLGAASSPSDAQLFAPAHLATLLLSEVAPSREVAAEKGGWGVAQPRCCTPLFLLPSLPSLSSSTKAQTPAAEALGRGTATLSATAVQHQSCALLIGSPMHHPHS